MFFPIIWTIPWLVPAALLAFVFYLSFKKTDKPWLKPFFSHRDFMKELLVSFAVTLLGFSWFKIFEIIVRNAPKQDSTWFVELWILLYIIILYLIAYIVRSYITLFLSIVASTIYVVVEVVKFSSSSYYFIDKNETSSSWSIGFGGNFIAPTGALGFTWILVNLLYVLGKKWSETKVFGRTGNLIRFAVILFNVVTLGILSNSYMSNFGIVGLLSGKTIFNSWGMILAILLILIATGLAIFWKKKTGLTYFELITPLVPGLAFVLYSLLPFLGFSSLQGFSRMEGPTSWNFTPLGLFWMILFNSLLFVYIIYLIYKSNQSHEKWLKIYSIVLAVGVLFYKIFDMVVQSSFSAIYLGILGTIILATVLIIEMKKQKSKPTLNQ